MFWTAYLQQDTRTMASKFESSASSPTITPWWETVCSHHRAQVKECLSAHHSFTGQHLQGNHHKSTWKYRKNELHLPCGSTLLSSEHSQSEPGDKEKKIFLSDLPHDFRAYTGFKCGARDGQNSGQPAMLGSARHWGRLAMLELNQEHLAVLHIPRQILEF